MDEDVTKSTHTDCVREDIGHIFEVLADRTDCGVVEISWCDARDYTGVPQPLGLHLWAGVLFF